MIDIHKYIQTLKWSSLLIILLITLGCTFETTEDKIDIKHEIRKQWDDFDSYWEQEDTDQLLMIYTEDAIIIPPGSEPVKGRQAIGEFYDMLFSNNASSKYEHQTLSVHQELNLAIEYGAFKVVWITNEGSEWTYKAKIMAHWEQSDEGNWEIKILMFNTPQEAE